MVTTVPRKGIVNTEAPDMVRVQLKPNDIRSYRRRDTEEILAANPEAFIIGEQEEAEKAAPVKASRSAPNKARQPKTDAPAPTTAPVETKSEPAPAGGQSSGDGGTPPDTGQAD